MRIFGGVGTGGCARLPGAVSVRRHGAGVQRPAVFAEHAQVGPALPVRLRGGGPRGLAVAAQGAALCGSHLLRDLRFIEDAHGHARAKRLRARLLNTCRRVREHPDKALSEPGCKALQKRCRTILTQAKKELPQPPPRRTKRRGRIAQSDAGNLHEALVKYETETRRFARDPEVPFTNHRAERDIRMVKVKQTVSGCFRTPHYAAVYCRISGCLQSMACQGCNPLAAIDIALNGNAADMVEKPTQNNQAEQDQKQGGE